MKMDVLHTGLSLITILTDFLCRDRCKDKGWHARHNKRHKCTHAEVKKKKRVFSCNTYPVA